MEYHEDARNSKRYAAIMVCARRAGLGCKIQLIPQCNLKNTNGDQVLPACSTSFVEKAKEFLPNVPILLHLLPGDHAFEVLYNINDEWVQKGIEFIEKYW